MCEVMDNDIMRNATVGIRVIKKREREGEIKFT